MDLFCGAGGAAVGYHWAGFDVIGVDLEPQPHYPFRFELADALRFPLAGIDVVHASPPCQAYSDLRHRTGRQYPDLIDPIRERLIAWDGPWVIENVEGAPLRSPIRLCGVQFPGLRVIRHRLFESPVPLAERPDHPKHPLVYTLDRRKAHYGRLDEWADFVSVNGGGYCSVAAALDAMRIPHRMTKAEVNEAIPPAYTAFLGSQILAQL